MEQRTALQEKDTIFYHLFEGSRIGQVILDDQLQLISVNKRMFEYFGLKSHYHKNMLWGQVFRCGNLNRSCSQCGKKENNRCDLMHGIKIIQANGHIENDTIQFPFIHNGNEEIKWFQLNGSSVYHQSQHYIFLTFSDITELKQRETRLKELLSLDLATGTMNKYGLLKTIKERIQKNKNVQYSLCMIDFDNFKQFNDHYGHLIGDKALEKFSDIAHQKIRKSDILGRYGGEEFVFLFDGINESQSFQILNRIHTELANYFFKTINHPVTFSAGVVTVRDQAPAPDDKALIGEADHLLYKAKGLGRSRAMTHQGERIFTT